MSAITKLAVERGFFFVALSVPGTLSQETDRMTNIHRIETLVRGLPLLCLLVLQRRQKVRKHVDRLVLMASRSVGQRW